MGRLAAWLDDPWSVQEIVRSASLRYFGVCLAGLHVLAWMFYAPDRALSEEHDPLQMCWPIYPDCYERALFSPFWAVAQGYLVLAGAGASAALFLVPRRPWATKMAHLLLLVLSLWRQIIFSHSYRYMGNYNQFGSYALTAYLLFPRKLEVLRLFLPSFYAIASLLKFNTEWLSGAAMISPAAVQGPLLLVGSVYVIVLEVLLLPWGLTHPGGWQFWFGVGNALYFHAFSWHLVGFYYPCIMTSLLVLPVLARLLRDDEWASRGQPGQGTEQAETTAPLPGICCGRYSTSPQDSVLATVCRRFSRRQGEKAAESSPARRHRRLAGSTVCALSWLWGQQFIPLLFGGDTALHGEGRFFSINMFDARGKCFATAFEHVVDGSTVPVTTDVSSDDILSLPGTGIRVKCDPMAFWTVARTLCAEANGIIFHTHEQWAAAKNATTAAAGAAAALAAGAVRGPGGPTGRLVDLDVYLQGRRTSDDDYTPLMQARRVCSQPQDFKYQLLSHNHWISPRNARPLGPLLRREELGLSNEDAPRTTSWKTAFAGPLAHGAAPEELPALQPFPTAGSGAASQMRPDLTSRPEVDPASWWQSAWSSLFPIAAPAIDVTRYNPAPSAYDSHTGRLTAVAASASTGSAQQAAGAHSGDGPAFLPEPDPVAAAFFATAKDSTWYNPVTLPVPFNSEGSVPPQVHAAQRVPSLAQPTTVAPLSMWPPHFLAPPDADASSGAHTSPAASRRGYVTLPHGHRAIDVREFCDLYGSGLGTALVQAALHDRRRAPEPAPSSGETCTDRKRKAGRKRLLEASEGMDLSGDPAADSEAVRALAADYIDVYDMAFLPPAAAGKGPGLVFLTSSASVLGLHGVASVLDADYHSDTNPHLLPPDAGTAAAASISTWIFNADTQGLAPPGVRPGLVLDEARVYAAAALNKGRLYGIEHATGALSWAVTVGEALLSPHRLIPAAAALPGAPRAPPEAQLRQPAGLYVLAQTTWGLGGPAGFGGTAMVGWAPPQVSLVKVRPADGVVVFRSPSITYTQHVVYDLAVDAASQLACVLVVRTAVAPPPPGSADPASHHHETPYFVVTCFSTQDGSIVTEVPLDPADLPLPMTGPSVFIPRPRRQVRARAGPPGWLQETDIPGVRVSALASLTFLPVTGAATAASPATLLITTAAGHIAVVRIAASAPAGAGATPKASAPVPAAGRINVTETVALVGAEAAAVVLEALGGDAAGASGDAAGSQRRSAAPWSRRGALAYAGHLGALAGATNFNPLTTFAVDGAPTVAAAEAAAALLGGPAAAASVVTFHLSRRAPAAADEPFMPDPYAEVDEDGAPVTVLSIALSEVSPGSSELTARPLWQVTTSANQGDLQLLMEERVHVLTALHRIAKAEIKDPAWTDVASFAADDDGEDEEDGTASDWEAEPLAPAAPLVAVQQPRRGTIGPAGVWMPTPQDLAEVTATDLSVLPSAAVEGDLTRAAQALADLLPRDAAAPLDSSLTGGAASSARLNVLRGATPEKTKDKREYSTHTDLHIPRGAGAGTFLGAAPRTPVTRPVATYWVTKGAASSSGDSGWAYAAPCPSDARFLCVFNAANGSLLEAAPMSSSYGGALKGVPLLLTHAEPPVPATPPPAYAAPFLPGASLLTLGDDNALHRLSVLLPAEDNKPLPVPPAGFRGARSDAVAAAEVAAAKAASASAKKGPRRASGAAAA